MKTHHPGSCIAALILMSMAALPALPQAPAPQRVYTTTASDSTQPSSVNGFAQTASSGALSITPGSPYSEGFDGAAMAVDAQGRFLFIANPTSNNISMFQIDQATGALSVVPNSPFASGPASAGLTPPMTPVALAVEPTGQYLYAGYSDAGSPSNMAPVFASGVITYRIDAIHSALIPLPQFEVDQLGQTIKALQVDVRGRNLYLANGSSGTGSGPTGVEVYQINPFNNALTLAATAVASAYGRSMIVDPQSRFLYYATGQIQGRIISWSLSPIVVSPARYRMRR